LPGRREAGEVGATAGAVEKLRCPRRERTEEKVAPALEVAHVEMGAAERARIGGGRSVDLGEVAVDDAGVRAGQPLAGDRERAEPACHREPGGLKERQRAAAGADEHEAGEAGLGFAARRVAHGEFPSSGGPAQADHAAAGPNVAVVLGAEPNEEAAGQFAEVDVGAGIDLGGGDGFVASALDEEWCPVVDGGGIGREGHRAEEWMRGERGVAGAEELDAVRPAHEAQVRDGTNILGGARREPVRGGPAPEVPRALEAGEDREGGRDVEAGVGRRGRRGVVEFAETGVAGAGVVPAVGAFAREVVAGLEHMNREARIQGLEKCTDVRGHDAAANQDHVGDGGRRHGRKDRAGARGRMSNVSRRRAKANAAGEGR
jgi:hypothetical protein